MDGLAALTRVACFPNDDDHDATWVTATAVEFPNIAFPIFACSLLQSALAHDRPSTSVGHGVHGGAFRQQSAAQARSHAMVGCAAGPFDPIFLGEASCMIKSKLVLRVAEQNPHLYNKATRSEPHWLGAIE
jgi:hypothetical protein